MKITVSNRSIYSKYVEVEIEVPDDINELDIPDYLVDNEYLYNSRIDEALSKAPLDFGFGLDHEEGTNRCYMNEEQSESEWRFDCEEKNCGGHF